MHAERERILNLPPVITALVCVFIAVQLVVLYAPGDLGQALFIDFAFTPARFAFLLDPVGVIGALASKSELGADAEGQIARALNVGPSAYVSPLSYAFLHGDWTHLGVNALSLIAFGSPVAKRCGDARFLMFMGFAAIAGALTHFALHPYDLFPVVGASAAISGTMGAIARFAFAPGSRLAEGADPYARQIGESPAIPLRQLASHRRVVMFVVSWLVLNFALGAFPQVVGVNGVIAWEAHIGGFVFGMLFFDFFDRAARRVF